MRTLRILIVAVIFTLLVAVVETADEADIFCANREDAIAYAHGEPNTCRSFIAWWGRPAEGELHFIEEVVGTPYAIFALSFSNGASSALVVIPSDV
jgi:hypothetical protein